METDWKLLTTRMKVPKNSAMTSRRSGASIRTSAVTFDIISSEIPERKKERKPVWRDQNWFSSWMSLVHQFLIGNWCGRMWRELTYLIWPLNTSMGIVVTTMRRVDWMRRTLGMRFCRVRDRALLLYEQIRRTSAASHRSRSAWKLRAKWKHPPRYFET